MVAEPVEGQYFNKSLRSTISKALYKSKIIMPVISALFILIANFDANLAKAVLHECSVYC